MSGSITVGGKTLASHDNGTGNLSLNNNVQFPVGHVIQVKSAIRNTEWQGPNTVNNNHTLFATDTSTTTAHTNTAFKVEITPATNASKFLVQYSICIGNSSTGISLKLHRYDGTTSLMPDSNYGSGYITSMDKQSSSQAWTEDANQSSQHSYSILDEPVTNNTLIYYVSYVYFGTQPYFNTNSSRNTEAYTDAYTSTLIVMEVAG